MRLIGRGVRAGAKERENAGDKGGRERGRPIGRGMMEGARETDREGDEGES